MKQKIHYHVYKSPPLVHTLNQINPEDILPSFYLKLILIVSPSLRLRIYVTGITDTVL